MATKKKTDRDFEDFVRGYVTAALWSSELDRLYGEQDIARDCRKKMRVDCRKFFRENRADLASYAKHVTTPNGSAYSYAGHDFWLTRNGHGAGFWDRNGIGVLGRPEGPEGLSERLSDAAHDFGSLYLYVHRKKIRCG